ncbi:PIN domain-containing protein [uncultured Amnibacterium sp.]|uniref:PIN domain-containing protein n=1 Tax=uncultured Amnibacterium sp. TaxID=1631851 RepID=UPI0035CA47B5
MTTVVDTSVLIDVLRGRMEAVDAVRRARLQGSLHASEITRIEVLAGVRRGEEASTSALLELLTWHPVDGGIARAAGELGRTWLPSHSGIDAADLAIAATVERLQARLLTRNVRHFPMIEGLAAPY